MNHTFLSALLAMAAIEASIGERVTNLQAELRAFLIEMEERLLKNPLFAQFHETTRLPCLYLLFGLGLIFLAILITGFGARAITNLIGFAYPLYRSLRAIKTSDKNDDTQWLMYWVIFGFFSLFESFTDFALGWLPLYFFGKIGFLLFCMLPQTQGAKLVFTNFLDPMILSPLENFGSEKDFLNSENKRE